MGAQLSHDEWIAEAAKRVAGGLGKDGLQPAGDLVALGGHYLTAALVAASAAALHSNGHLLDSLVERMATGRWLRDETRYLDVAVAAISTYRLGRFPGPPWWDAVVTEVSFLECWADRASRSAPRPEVEDLLRSRWLVEEKAIPIIAEGLGDPGAGPLAVIEAHAARSPMIARVRKEAENTMAQTRAAVPAEFANHRKIAELRSAVGFFYVLEDLRKTLDEGPGEQEAREELEELSVEIKKTTREEVMRLSTLESLGMSRVPDFEQTLQEVVERTRKSFHVPALAPELVIPNGLSDRFHGHTLVTDHLTDDVFSAGGRSGLLAWGPTAYMWLVLEKHEVPREELLPLGLGAPAGAEVPFDLILQVAADEDDPLCMSYQLGHSDETRRWLAMLALSGRITVDVFEIDDDNRLRLLLRATHEVGELIEELRPRIAAVVEHADPEPLLTGNELEEHVIAGFGLSENAKSELLLTLASDVEAADRDVLASRRKLLDAHVSRAWTLYTHGNRSGAEARVEEAMRAYAKARSRVERKPRQRLDDPQAAHRALVADFACEGRAVVHYNFKSNHIQGFWSANEGEDHGWISGEQIDLADLVAAAKPWLEDKHGDVEELLAAAAPVADELAEALSEVEVDEVLIIPWAVLNGLPFAAVPLEEGTLGDRYRISYAPSLAMLRPLVDAGDSPKASVEMIAAHDGSLRWAGPEVAAAGTVYPGAVVTPDRSPREQVIEAIERGRIVHLATHGEWWRDDPFASSLDLRSGGPFDRHISAAEIYRDVDLHGAELVTLSACDTGRSPSLSQGIETYSGLDAAFLAKGSKAVISTLWPIDDLAAMLFMTNLHAELALATPLSEAFQRSVDLVRSGQLKSLPADHPVATALDAVGVEWRRATAERAEAFRTARYWAAFKLSGVPWLSRPLPQG